MAASSSCEPRRTSAYSNDLRWRIIWQRDGLGLTLDQVSTNLSIHKSTVLRINSAFKESGLISKKSYPRDDYVKPNKKLSRPVQFYIIHYVLQNPSSYNGVNCNCIVVLDNASIHHVEGVVDIISETGALVYFLPPYSPDLAPIEECFAKVKSAMRSMEQEAQVSDRNYYTAGICNCNPPRL